MFVCLYIDFWQVFAVSTNTFADTHSISWPDISNAKTKLFLVAGFVWLVDACVSIRYKDYRPLFYCHEIDCVQAGASINARSHIYTLVRVWLCRFFSDLLFLFGKILTWCIFECIATLLSICSSIFNFRIIYFSPSYHDIKVARFCAVWMCMCVILMVIWHAQLSI